MKQLTDYQLLIIKQQLDKKVLEITKALKDVGFPDKISKNADSLVFDLAAIIEIKEKLGIKL